MFVPIAVHVQMYARWKQFTLNNPPFLRVIPGKETKARHPDVRAFFFRNP
jgi:hypothetical protein